MECREVRELLPENVLGILEDGDAVREHLAWCAACRKEAGELAEGAEVLGVSQDADPPPGLEDRVARAFVAEAGPARRRSRGPAAVAVAATLAALMAVGWGAAMAGRAERLDGEAESARLAAAEAARELGVVLETLSEHRVREAALIPTDDAAAGGRALVYDTDADGASDWALVVVGGLPDDGGPYVAKLRGRGGGEDVGRLWPSAEGRLAGYALYPDLSGGLDSVVVMDADGAVVLSGSLEAP